jgi:tRNA nucleotidyltransferase (CCA-adding enzyme)
MVIPLVVCHMDHLGATIDKRFVRRLAKRLYPANVRLWESVVECDASGRPPLRPGRPGVYALVLAEAENITLNKPGPLLMGRHLIERGHLPGPAMGELLRQAYEAQLDGHFDTLEGALEWLANRLANDQTRLHLP